MGWVAKLDWGGMMRLAEVGAVAAALLVDDALAAVNISGLSMISSAAFRMSSASKPCAIRSRLPVSICHTNTPPSEHFTSR